MKAYKKNKIQTNEEEKTSKNIFFQIKQTKLLINWNKH